MKRKEVFEIEAAVKKALAAYAEDAQERASSAAIFFVQTGDAAHKSDAQRCIAKMQAYESAMTAASAAVREFLHHAEYEE